MTALIPRDTLETTCLIGQGHACCRYIVGSSDGIQCAKHMPDLRSEIDRRVSAEAMVARGDNCEGLT